jgi:Flp pilus assembly pilin Flp
MLAAADGATAIEYAVMAAGIALVIVTAVFALGDQVATQLYGRVAAAFGGWAFFAARAVARSLDPAPPVRLKNSRRRGPHPKFGARRI